MKNGSVETVGFGGWNSDKEAVMAGSSDVLNGAGGRSHDN